MIKTFSDFFFIVMLPLIVVLCLVIWMEILEKDLGSLRDRIDSLEHRVSVLEKRDIK